MNKEYARIYRQENKEKLKEYQKSYYAKRGKTNYELFGKHWYSKNKQRNLERGRTWAKTHRKRIVEIVLKSREKHKDKFLSYHSKYYKSPIGKYVDLKNRNKKRKYEGKIITIEEFTELINQLCVYCGGENITKGIDRVDNFKGYTKENSVSCCKKCNYMKNTWSKEEFLFHIQKIYKHQLA